MRNSFVVNSIIWNATVERMVEKMRVVFSASAEAWGEFSLFGLFQRQDSAQLWDVVVSAPWLPEGRDGIYKIAQQITARLNRDEALLISHIVVLSPDSTFVRALNDLAESSDEPIVRVGPLALEGVEIERGYVLASHRNPRLIQAA